MNKILAGFFLALLTLITGLAPGVARANDLETLQQRGTFMWGADQEGGGPYVYPQDDNPEEVTGFEVDLAAKLAEYLKVKPEFTQGAWDALPDMLRANKMDVIMNGYEWTPELALSLESTMPYYVYGLQLMVREDSPVQSWDDLCKPMPDGSKPRLGALVGSAAETLLREPEYDGPCEVIAYDGNTDAMREVETGKLQGTLQDTPIATFYAPQFPKLRNVGDPVGEGYYVMYVRKDQRELAQALNEAIILMVRSGELEKIYRRYGIWDKNQEKLVRLAEQAKFYGYLDAVSAEVEQVEMPTQEEVKTAQKLGGWGVVETYFPVLAESAVMTVILSALSFPIAIAVGLLVAVGRLYGPAVIRAPLTAYVELLRGTPLMLQLYFIFFFLPEVGVNIPAFWCAILGLAVNYSAYESEIYRAGLQAIPLGQMEAAESLGMSRGKALRRIIVPQAFRIVIPPVVNDFIALFKDTSVCSVVTVMELTKQFSVQSRSSGATIEMMIMTAILYMLMSYPMSLLARKLETRLGGGGVR